MTDSRRKGAAGEREFAKAMLDTYQVKLYRRLEQVRSGGHDLSVDPDCDGAVTQWLIAHAIEVKRYRTVTPALISTWWAQTTIQAASAGLVPMLAYRADRHPWVIVLKLSELIPAADGTFSVSLESIGQIADVRFGDLTTSWRQSDD